MKIKPFKEPVIRKGQKVPYHKATAQEVERRVEMTIALLGRHAHRGQIHDYFRKLKTPDGSPLALNWRTTDVYIARARKRMIEESGKPKESHRLDSYHTYWSIIRDPKASNTDRLSAQSRIDRLLGLEEPQRREVTGAAGMPLIPPSQGDVVFKGLDLGTLNEIAALLRPVEQPATTIAAAGVVMALEAGPTPGPNGKNGDGQH